MSNLIDVIEKLKEALLAKEDEVNEMRQEFGKEMKKAEDQILLKQQQLN